MFWCVVLGPGAAQEVVWGDEASRQPGFWDEEVRRKAWDRVEGERGLAAFYFVRGMSVFTPAAVNSFNLLWSLLRHQRIIIERESLKEINEELRCTQAQQNQLSSAGTSLNSLHKWLQRVTVILTCTYTFFLQGCFLLAAPATITWQQS